MKSHFLCFSLLLTVSLAARIEYSLLSAEENNQLQETCGRDVHYHTKVLNGETADKFPSAASVNIKGVLTASIISPRHVLLFNIFEFDKETMRLSLFNDTELIEKGDCDVNDWILPEEVNEWFVVKFANGKGDEKQENKVRRIAVLGGCIAIDTYKPMILELENNMEFDEGHGPVCIPSIEDVEEFKGEEEFTVYGLGPKGDKLTSAQFIEKECEKNHDWNHVFCGKALNESKGLCSGDFGGGAIVRSGDMRSVLLGVYAEGNTRCETSPQIHQESEFIDIRNYTDSICRQTGVCPNAVEDFTEGPYVNGGETDEVTETPEYVTEAPSTLVTLETIIAETYEKMRLNNCSNSESEEIHIHIHLNRNV